MLTCWDLRGVKCCDRWDLNGHVDGDEEDGDEEDGDDDDHDEDWHQKPLQYVS